MLFVIYLLLGASPPVGNEDTLVSRTDVDHQADEQIRIYVRGKILISMLVGCLTAIALWACSVDLWLVFGLLAFWLNVRIKNVRVLDDTPCP